MESTEKILYIEDDKIDKMAFERFIKEHGFPYEHKTAGSFSEAKKILTTESFDAVISDFFLGDGTALDILQLCKNQPVIIVTGAGDEETAVKAMKEGASNYLVKDIEHRFLKTLHLTIANAIKKRKTENELEKYRSSLEITNLQLSDEINKKEKLLQALKDKNRELESFVNTASHDLKGPLFVMGGMSKILLKKYNNLLDEKGVEYLEIIRANVIRMEELIKDLLELSMSDSKEINKEYCKVEDILHGINIRHAIKTQHKNIDFQVMENLPSPFADKTRLSQIFENLITNAMKFMGNESKQKIEIGHLETVENYNCFYIKDNGIGIDENKQKIIFREFYRLNDIECEGTGIGLAIVKKIVQHHGGKIWIESSKGEGSTFFFTLPKIK